MTTLDLGPKLPQLLSCSLPWQDELGLWFDVDVEFKSICTATVQTQGTIHTLRKHLYSYSTKLNLIKYRFIPQNLFLFFVKTKDFFFLDNTF